jgi:hypothetical protein
LDAAQKSGEAGNLKRDKGFAPMNIAKMPGLPKIGKI